MNVVRHLRYQLLRIDGWMLACISALMVIGIVFIYSAGYRGNALSVGSFYQKQIVWAVIGFAVYMLAAIVDYHRVAEYTWWIYGISLVLLILVLLVGKRVYGATRWISLFGFHVQPSELAKLSVIITLAHFMSRPGRTMAAPSAWIQAIVLMGIPFVLILKEPDLGTSMVLIPVLISMLFVAGISWKTLLGLGVSGLACMPLGWFMLGDYQKERLLVFVDPGRDPLGAGWNKIQSEIAVGSGGMWGKGFLEGTQNVLGFLPRTVAPTDFIYSVIAEETGFVGSIVLICLFACLLAACLKTAVRSRDRFGELLCVGVAAMIFSHVFVNIAMTIGFMPITGLPLPLISYGGSFMVSTMAALGIVQSVYIRRYRR